MAKLEKGMLSSVEQAFAGRDEKRAPLKTPAREASIGGNRLPQPVNVFQAALKNFFCSVILGQLESFRNYKGFSLTFPNILAVI